MHGAPIGILFFAGAIALACGDAVLAAEPIKLGKYRQLFVDDFWIDESKDTTRSQRAISFATRLTASRSASTSHRHIADGRCPGDSTC